MPLVRRLVAASHLSPNSLMRNGGWRQCGRPVGGGGGAAGSLRWCGRSRSRPSRVPSPGAASAGTPGTSVSHAGSGWRPTSVRGGAPSSHVAGSQAELSPLVPHLLIREVPGRERVVKARHRRAQARVRYGTGVGREAAGRRSASTGPSRVRRRLLRGFPGSCAHRPTCGPRGLQGRAGRREFGGASRRRPSASAASVRRTSGDQQRCSPPPLTGDGLRLRRS